MSNKFYIISTPIGNMKEINKRAIEAFNDSKTFFCEDTRVTKKLLSKLNINYDNKIFVVNNIYTENKIDFELIKKMIDVGSCALVSDAGYPMISDPGYKFWEIFNKLKIIPEIINGSSAILHALLLSGFPTNNFYFQGFLSNNKSKKELELLNLKKINATIVIFEGANKLLDSLKFIQKVFGDINICVLKELTKLNEKRYFGKISNLLNQIDLRGEFVIVMENIFNQQIDNNIIWYEINKLVKSGNRLKDACKIVAYKYEMKPNQLYLDYEKIKNE
ncbi:MAG: 16S rRNA (cytidine(1402)-2'-O)-methyltransferase [Mycoplasmoidaceae bacterium]